MKTRIGLLLLLSILLASLVNCQTNEAPRPDFGGDGIFSYVPPKGWAVIKAPGFNLKYKAAVGPAVRGFAPNIIVIPEESAKSLDEYSTAVMESLKTSLEGFTFLEKNEFETSGGVRGIKLVTESDDTSGASKVKLRQVYYLFKSGPKALAATCTRRVEDDKTIDQAFDSAMKTFRITKASEAKPQTSDRPDFGGDHSFSYVPPPGWKVVNSPLSKYNIAQGESAQGITPNINVIVEQYPKSLDEFVASALEELKTNKDHVLLGKSDFQTSDGVRGIKVMFEFDSGEAKNRFRACSYAFKEGPRVFFATCGSLASDGAKHDAAFDAAMKTFRFTKSAEETKPSAAGHETKPPAGWKTYSYDKAGISFNYPARCELYDQKEKLPEKLRNVWQDHTLVFCLDLKPPMINFNIGMGKEATPASSSFTEWWDSLSDAICQQRNLTRLSFKGLKVGGRDAAEMVAVDKKGLKYKNVYIEGYDSNQFAMVFVAPSKDYDSLDKEVYKPWVDGVKVFKPAQEQKRSQDKRQIWEHTDRLFKDQGNKRWIETDRLGKVLFTFTETDRNSDFIEIQDSSRGYTVRLYGNATYINGGSRQDLKKFDQFTKYYDGKWSAMASGQDKDQPSLVKKAEQGDAAAQVNLGRAYEAGKEMPKDLGEAVKCYRKAADQGNAQGQFYLARLYQHGNGVERDYQMASHLYRKSAEQGHAGAQNNLGVAYQNGHGVPKDYKEAVVWYRKSAEQGDAWAQANLGYMCSKGFGVPKDEEEAATWYKKSADHGNALGQNNLGNLYRMGQGVERDYQKALELFSKSAAQGHALGQANLGLMYEKGYGAPKNEKEAVSWFRKSADQGEARGQYNLGRMYQQGLGVAEDRQEALKWYQKAAAQGHEDAKKALIQLNAK
jgi:TPR repeat protein